MKSRGSFKQDAIVKNDAPLEESIRRSAALGSIDLRTLQAV
jgi:hypothetical protein